MPFFWIERKQILSNYLSYVRKIDNSFCDCSFFYITHSLDKPECRRRLGGSIRRAADTILKMRGTLRKLCVRVYLGYSGTSDVVGEIFLCFIKSLPDYWLYLLCATDPSLSNICDVMIPSLEFKICEQFNNFFRHFTSHVFS